MRRYSGRVDNTREGNAAFLALVALTLLAGLSLAQFAVSKKSLEKSDFFLSRVELRRYAESGTALALHYLRSGIDGGQIGTVDWDAASDDVGADGIGGTSDQGEDDGIPTPGEPNLAPATVGAGLRGVGLLVHVSDTTTAGVKLIVATSFTEQGAVTLETQVQQISITVPDTGPAYLPLGASLTLNGNSFAIDGTDSLPGGGFAPTSPATDQYGLSTDVGGWAALLALIGINQEDNVDGLDGPPSIGEGPPIDIDALVSQYSSAPNQEVTSGTYSNVTWGDWSTSDLQITYCPGDLHLSGQGNGAGVLIVDGDLDVSGQFEFTGLVIVTGEANFTGGGSGTHVWGTVLAKTGLRVQGSAELRYCSEALDAVAQSNRQNAGYETVYYAERSH